MNTNNPFQTSSNLDYGNCFDEKYEPNTVSIPEEARRQMVTALADELFASPQIGQIPHHPTLGVHPIRRACEDVASDMVSIALMSMSIYQFSGGNSAVAFTEEGLSVMFLGDKNVATAVADGHVQMLSLVRLARAQIFDSDGYILPEFIGVFGDAARALTSPGFVPEVSLRSTLMNGLVGAGLYSAPLLAMQRNLPIQSV